MKGAPVLVLASVVMLAPLAAQQPATPVPEFKPLEIGSAAPDFALPAATRFGLLKAPVHLSDFKGKTVVLAFFYKARTRG
ncbi:MAG TPA: hypothetical protein VJ816_03735 [Gemmatimonadales bacterium]|nr:hypothetical protein [Gemmatimonadales bacterium]